MPKRSPEAIKLLRGIMAATGWKIYQLAAVIGVPPATVSRWLHGHHRMSRAWEAAIKNNSKLKKFFIGND